MTGTTCRAPSVSMYFDVNGSVLACCHNVLHPLGSVLEEDLVDIWRGARAEELRARLAEGDLRSGCDACAFQIEAGHRSAATAATFDPFAPGAWPTRLEFALSNRCNLACVMCSGQFSSRIRSEREGLPPLPQRYGDDFFEQLRPFLPHVEEARFFGGEPFLIPEYHRIWDLMIEEGVAPRCRVTTNGTVLTPGVRRALEALPFDISVSLDGATAATVEAIRVGADHDALIANVEWFHRRCAERGTSFDLTYCLMADNWHELGDFLLLADVLEAGVAVNRVVTPVRNSLYALPLADLEVVVAGLEAEDVELRGRLGEWNRRVWADQLGLLRAQLDELRAEPTAGPDRRAAADLLDDLLDRGPFASVAEVVDAVGPMSVGQVDCLQADASDVIVDTGEETFLGLPAAQFVGAPTAAVLERLSVAFGGQGSVLADRVDRGLVGRVVAFEGPAEPSTLLVVSTPAPWDGRPGQAHVVAPLDLPRAGRPVAITGAGA